MARGRRRDRNALWLRAPVVLLRYPKLLLAVALGALLLAVSVAAYPLFLSAETNHLVEAAIERPGLTRFGAGILYQVRVAPLHTKGEGFSPTSRGGAFDAFTDEPRLGPTIASALGPPMRAFGTRRPGRWAPIALFSGTGARAHVEVLGRAGQGGVWLDDRTARSLGVGKGDRVTIGSEAGVAIELRVTGRYAALAGRDDDGYWGAWDASIHPFCASGDCAAPAAFAIVEPARMPRLLDRLEAASATYSWQAPVRSAAISWTAAGSLGEFEEHFSQEASRELNVFQCCGSVVTDEQEMNVRLTVGMPAIVEELRRTLATLDGPGRVLRAAGVAVALAVVAAAGAFSVSARGVESRLLFARGTAARTVGALTAIGAAVPSLAGAAAGFGVALLIARAGAGGDVAARASGDGLRAAALAALASLALLSLVAAIAYANAFGLRRRRLGVLARVPWELALVGVAAVALVRIRGGGAFVRDPALGVGRPSASLLLFPVVAIGGLSAVGSRGFLALVRWVRGRSGRFTSWLYLAVHRMAGAPRVAVLLVATTALCLGLAVHTQTVVRSLQSTVDAKAGVFVGSDVSARVVYGTGAPDPFPLPLTRVTRVPGGVLIDGDRRADLLAIDPGTFEAAAFWNPGFSDVPLSEIVRRLSEPAARGIPIAVTGNVRLPSTLRFSGRDVPVRVVARPDAFPGTSSLRPLVVVDESLLVQATSGGLNPLATMSGSTELWVRGEAQEALTDLQATGKTLYLIRTADRVRNIPRIAAVIRTFRVLNALGLVAGALVVLGMLMYLQARQRSQEVSYGLSLRMGMTHARHRRSLTVELGAMLGFSYAIGLVLALGVAVVIARLLDPLESIPPGALLVIPGGSILATLAAVLGLAWVSGWFINRRARAVDLGEVMRLAE